MSQPRTRWIVIAVPKGGFATAYGPWYDVDKAKKHAEQLRSRGKSAHIAPLERWPGIKAITAAGKVTA